MRTRVEDLTTSESDTGGLSLDYFRRLGSPIAAPATASGGPLVIVRVSGKDLSLIEPMIPDGFPRSGTFALRSLRDVSSEQGGILDRSLVLYFKAPHSFTGEDVVEFHCHGVLSLIDQLMECLQSLGVRGALPGEFSFRAVVHNKMTLEEAEALNGALGSESLTVKGASRLLCLSSQSSDSVNFLLRELLLGVQTARGRIEAAIDFPEAESEQAHELSGALESIQKVQSGMAALETAYYNFGQVSSEARVVIAGRPNVGKSTLYNVLCGGKKALVSKIPGTTRDVLECRVRTTSGRWVRILDTAGIRKLSGNNPHDELEKIGMESGLEALLASRVVVFVAKSEAGEGTAPGSRSPFQTLGLSSEDAKSFSQKALYLYSHADETESLPHLPGHFDFRSEESAVRRYVLDGIEKKLLEQEANTSNKSIDLGILSSRQAQLIGAAHDEVERAHECVNGMRPLELSGDHLRECESLLKKAVGEGLGDEYMGQIFSQFCLGK